MLGAGAEADRGGGCFEALLRPRVCVDPDPDEPVAAKLSALRLRPRAEDARGDLTTGDLWPGDLAAGDLDLAARDLAPSLSP